MELPDLEALEQEAFDRYRCTKWLESGDRCPNPGEERYDQYGIYAGRTCDDHIPYCARTDSSGEPLWSFDAAYAGESLEEE